jgi:hypothetical protein
MVSGLVQTAEELSNEDFKKIARSLKTRLDQEKPATTKRSIAQHMLLHMLDEANLCKAMLVQFIHNTELVGVAGKLLETYEYRAPNEEETPNTVPSSSALEGNEGP